MRLKIKIIKFLVIKLFIKNDELIISEGASKAELEI